MAEQARIPGRSEFGIEAPVTSPKVNVSPLINSLGAWANQLLRRSEERTRSQLQEMALEAGRKLDPADIEAVVDESGKIADFKGKFQATLIDDRDVRDAVSQYIDVFNTTMKKLVAKETADELRSTLNELRASVDPRVSPEAFETMAEELRRRASDSLAELDPEGELANFADGYLRDVTNQAVNSAKTEYVNFQRDLLTAKGVQQVFSSLAESDDNARSLAAQAASGQISIEDATNKIVSDVVEVRARIDELSVVGGVDPRATAGMRMQANDRMIESFLGGYREFLLSQGRVDEYMANYDKIVNLVLTGTKHEVNRLPNHLRDASAGVGNYIDCLKEDWRRFRAAAKGTGERSRSFCVAPGRVPTHADFIRAASALISADVDPKTKQELQSIVSASASLVAVEAGATDVIKGQPLSAEDAALIQRRRKELDDTWRKTAQTNPADFVRAVAKRALPTYEDMTNAPTLIAGADDAARRTEEAERLLMEDVIAAMQRGTAEFAPSDVITKLATDGLKFVREVDGKKVETVFTLADVGIPGANRLAYVAGALRRGEDPRRLPVDSLLFDSAVYKGLADSVISAADAGGSDFQVFRTEYLRNVTAQQQMMKAADQWGVGREAVIYGMLDANIDDDKRRIPAAAQVVATMIGDDNAASDIVWHATAGFDIAVRQGDRPEGNIAKMAFDDAFSRIIDSDAVDLISRGGADKVAISQALARAAAAKAVLNDDDVADVTDSIIEQLKLVTEDAAAELDTVEAGKFLMFDQTGFAPIADEVNDLVKKAIEPISGADILTENGVDSRIMGGKPFMQNGRLMFLSPSGKPILHNGKILVIDIKKFERDFAAREDRNAAARLRNPRNYIYIGEPDAAALAEFRNE